jgi:sulfate adenylyltransferase
MSIAPHGGELIDRRLQESDAQAKIEAMQGTRRVTGDRRILTDLYLIAVGALSPLTGFMDRTTYQYVVDEMHLPSGDVFSVPVTLPVDKAQWDQIAEGDDVMIDDEHGKEHAVLTVSEKFERDVRREARNVYRTEDENHPGVKAVYDGGPYCLAGDIAYVNTRPDLMFQEHNLTPAQTRAFFAEKGWKRIVAFQTRNPIHRAHEYIIKCGLEITDGALIHPLVGPTKKGDIPPEVRMECYKTLIDNYFVKERVLLGVLPAAMRYAGPREAIFHAIMRKNYGCTHFIVGRDHAGVGDYYGTYDAQKIFDEIDLDRFGMEPLMFEHAFYCKLTKEMATGKTSPAGKDDKIFLSGTKVREMLKNGELPPEEFSRPEVAKILMEWAQREAKQEA